MKTYAVCIPWFASVTVTVVAKSKKEALDVALAEANVSLCHQCAHAINLEDPDFDHCTVKNVEELK